ncbi:nuclear transport factor 2 family protein [Halioglobus maricola]|uniref:Nuclear transport factor 2 family protein n=1 Tax=Halioglobus maricola TaxID=2601894 RepID=A0A5P9NMU3_9GAMM|nr:nuclear transport factor 2 family protein [Halioglobus maricola]QFU77072.1 nuclear transport factor 2 family protein [Halioglobus maricola]
MYRIFLTLLLQFVVSINSQASTEVEVFEPIDKLFAAISNVKHQDMRATVTESFVLLEDGEVWTIEDLISVVSPSEYARTNFFSIINIETMNDIALVNYWNKANFDNKKSSEDVIWLESAVIKKVNGMWLILQMHSTRLEPNAVSENVVFTQQKI